MGHLYALDFDGVLCDTCEETAISALKVLALSPCLFYHLVINKMERKKLKIVHSF